MIFRRLLAKILRFTHFCFKEVTYLELPLKPFLNLAVPLTALYILNRQRVGADAFRLCCIVKQNLRLFCLIHLSDNIGVLLK